LLDYPAHQLLTHPALFRRRVDPRDRGRVQRWRRRLLGGRALTLEYRLRRRDGKVVEVLDRAQPLVGADGKVSAIDGILEDVTERKRLQAELLQAERMASIGRMSAQVAHEIRNPLAALSLNVELLADELAQLPHGDTAEAKALLDSLLKEVERLSGIVEEYLQYSRLPPPKLAAVELNALIADLLDFNAAGLIPARVRLHWQPAAGELRAQVDPGQIRQVLLNLIKNAIEAMPAGGTLTIRSAAAAGGARVEVEDTGTGIRPGDLDKIFDPFYTTKEVGTGLGLALARQLLERQNSRIECRSVFQSGTTFSIWLPSANPGSGKLDMED
jgi:signal transduction histidine kinase